MNKKIKFRLSVLIYVCTLLGIMLGINSYIDGKHNSLRNKAYTAVNSFFYQKPFLVDVLYQSNNLDYIVHEPMRLPKVSPYGEQDAETQNIRRQMSEFLEEFDKSYDIKINPQEQSSGWALKVVTQLSDHANLSSIRGGTIGIYLIYPKTVQYKTVPPLLSGSIPSIENAVNETLDYLISDSESEFQPYYSRGCTHNIEIAMKNYVNNEYYFLKKLDNRSDIIPLFNDGGSIENGYYKVSFTKKELATYCLTYIGDDALNKEKLMLGLFFILIVTILELIISYIIKKGK